ncbi:SDR family oxidoreductase [Solirubrum puertoriconensis]|uniref:Short-chain dehydrogenase n=1 Tax=Solirubrum puertoriconensis TaxID=1751427 RepID=A0A9X0L4U6_SOLP1|nr:SDR family oxidoreductase [Solirubrum puertoriconensis]KUG08028.1 short-chain dehydrogenase [Solirubrum puertoriconensis]
MNFRNQVIWLTGASSGIGEALAKAFAHEGARLVLSARNEAELRRVQQICAPAEALVLPLDLGDAASLPGKVQQVLAHYGRLDVLVNNGGVSQRSLALETSLAVDRRLMEVNYFGTVALSKAALPHLLQQSAGRIVTISSLVGKFGTPYRSAYAASKHALHGFFDSLRAELHGSGVGITIICPGFIRTGVSINALTGDGRALGTMDEATEKGLSPEAFARRALPIIARGDNEAYIGGKETLGVYLKRFAPAIFAKLLTRTKVR